MKSVARIWIWLALGASALGLLVALGATRRRPAPERTAAPATLACRFAVGDTLAFQVHSVSTSKGVTPAAQGGTAPRVASVKGVDLEATMHWRVLETKGTGWLVAAALDAVKLQQPGDGSAVAPADRQRDLGDPFVIELGRDCRFRSLGFGPRFEAGARAQIEGLMGALEIAHPILAVARWSARQRDGFGEFLAQYEHTAADGPAIIQRRRTAYLRAHNEGNPIDVRPQMKILRSAAQATSAGDGRWLSALVSDDHLEISLADRPVAEVTLRVTLKAVERGALARLEGLATAQFVWGQSGSPRPTRSTPVPATPAVAAATLQSALDEFARRLPGSGRAFHDAVAGLAGYFASRPEAITEVMARLRAGQIDLKLRAGLFLALEMTGTPQAERALAGAITDRSLLEVDRMRAAAALADVAQPSQQAFTALAEGARQSGDPEVASTSLLALGTLGHNAATAQPALTAQIRDELSARLSGGPTRGDVVAALDAAGNLGDPRLGAAVAPYTKDPSPKVRAHAAAAYRRSNDLDSEKLLIDWLAHEPVGTVRRAIVEALAERVAAADSRTPSSSLLAAVMSRLPMETDVRTRGLLIELLGVAAGTVPEAKRALIEQFRREDNVELQQMIGKFCSADELG